MPRPDSLNITDQYETRFLFFDPLETMWNRIPENHPAEQDRKTERTHPSCLVVIDRNVKSTHEALLSTVFPPETSRYFEVPPGESSKSIAMWNRIIDFAFSGPLRRNTPLVAIGGGVTGDLAGFAAATLMRGLPLYHIPTTLLAMVDSAIGGKTGINHDFGKNTIGSFYHPEAVLFDTSFLETLPEREWLCGISEVLKYGYIMEPELLDKAANLADPARRTPELLRSVIESSVRIKAWIVAEDARESGIRAWLNFGHTFAHALEALDKYRNINHGEAVYAGMIAAVYLSRRQGADVTDDHLLQLKNIYNINLDPYTTRVDELVTLMGHDKKNRDHTVRPVLLNAISDPYTTRIDDTQLLKQAWHYTFDTLRI